MITKLRPFARTFLKEASHIYDKHIYIHNRQSSLRITNGWVAWPEKGVYFFTSSSRVISCDDHSSPGQKKCLDLLRGCKDSNVLILDDTCEAWTKENQDNFIVIRHIISSNTVLRQCAAIIASLLPSWRRMRMIILSVFFSFLSKSTLCSLFISYPTRIILEMM